MKLLYLGQQDAQLDPAETVSHGENTHLDTAEGFHHDRQSQDETVESEQPDPQQGGSRTYELDQHDPQEGCSGGNSLLAKFLQSLLLRNCCNVLCLIDFCCYYQAYIQL